MRCQCQARLRQHGRPRCQGCAAQAHASRMMWWVWEGRRVPSEQHLSDQQHQWASPLDVPKKDANAEFCFQRSFVKQNNVNSVWHGSHCHGLVALSDPHRAWCCHATRESWWCELAPVKLFGVAAAWRPRTYVSLAPLLLNLVRHDFNLWLTCLLPSQSTPHSRMAIQRKLRWRRR